MAHDSDVITPRAPSSVVVNLMIRRVENPEVPQWLETQLALLCGTQGGALVVCIGWGNPRQVFFNRFWVKHLKQPHTLSASVANRCDDVIPP